MAFPIQHDMIDCNGTKTFLGSKKAPKSLAARASPQTPLDDGLMEELTAFYTPLERMERRDEFASNLDFLATQLWQITIAPKASVLI